MPLKKKYVRAAKRAFKGKRKSTIKKLVKKVNKLYKGIETKHYNVAGLGALPDNNPSLAIRPYPDITQGLTDYGSRIGDKITVKFVRFRSVWEHGAGFNSRVGRIIVFIAKENPDGIAAAWSTIWNLYSESAYANSVNIVNGGKDYDNKSNFVTLYDQRRVFNPEVGDKTKSHIWDINIRIPQRNQNVQYIGASTTVTKNELYIALLQDTDNGLSINYVTEFFYSDT